MRINAGPRSPVARVDRSLVSGRSAGDASELAASSLVRVAVPTELFAPSLTEASTLFERSGVRPTWSAVKPGRSGANPR